MKKVFPLLFFLLASKILFAQNLSDSLIVNHYGDTVKWKIDASSVKSFEKDSQMDLLSVGEPLQMENFSTITRGEASNWVFGSKLGMRFNPDGTKSFFYSSMSAREGCASISDSEGNLLLYTNGLDVFNSLGQKINTQMLQGSNLSTQSGVIVPYPGSNTKYFIFTVPDTYENSGLNYSIVDMSLINSQGGPGVLLKVDGENEYKLIKENCVERLASVRHKNGTDYWIIADYKGINEYYCYRITESGIDIDNPVINAIGSDHIGSNTYGGVKFSSDGKKFASARGGAGNPRIEIFDFNNETGLLSNYRDITPNTGANSFYGLEFSPDGQFLYIATLVREIFQADLLTGTTDLILNAAPGGINGGMLQQGIDGNIYFAYRNSGLYYFSNPNEKKYLGSFNISSIYTGSNVGLGLPTFISSFTNSNCLAFDIDFKHYPHFCGTKFVPEFENKNDCDIINYLWEFGDGSTSTDREPFHSYASQGVYDVKLVMNYNCNEGCGNTSNTVIHTIDLTQNVFEKYQTIDVITNIQDSVLTATASSFSDSWPLEYDDDSLQASHPFLSGEQGIWRNDASYVFRNDRNYSDKPDVARDGTYTLETFNWNWSKLDAIPGWLKGNTITQYSPYTYELENKDILGNYSSAIYGYAGQLPVAVGQNMKNSEMAFTGFEELDASGFTIIDDASQKGVGNWTLSIDAEPSESRLFNTKIGIGNLVLVGRPLSDFENIDKVNVLAEINNLLPGWFGLRGYRKYKMARKVDILCKETYEVNNNWTVLVLDRVIHNGLWMGHLWVYIPGKRGTIADVTDIVSHTGKKSLRITSPKRIKQNYLELEPQKEYVLSAWVSINDKFLYVPVLAENLGIRLLFFDENDTQVGNVFLEPKGNIIEGWQKLEEKFIYPESATYFSLEYDPGTATTAYFDDLRLFPSEGSMQTYVYELDTYRLQAVMDENNFASLYYYDPEGNLYLVKKETEEGLRAIQETVWYQKGSKTE